MVLLPTYSDIQKAHLRIAGYVHHTPVHTSSGIDEMIGARVYFKCENFQKVGAFKYRGATNAVLLLSGKEAEKGVATHSSGNHAAALALAALKRGIKCYVVMPKTAPAPKVEAVKCYGAEITFCEPNLQSREETLNTIVARTGAVIIHPTIILMSSVARERQQRNFLKKFRLWKYCWFLSEAEDCCQAVHWRPRQ
jgi:threonine dehydratase